MLNQKRYLQNGIDGERNRRAEMHKRHEHVRDLLYGQKCAAIAKKYYEAVKERDIRPLMREISYEGKINEINYFEALKMLITTEEAHQAVEMRKHDKTDYEILYQKDPLKVKYYVVELSGQADNSLLDISDCVLLEDPTRRKALLLRILAFKNDYVILSPREFDESYLDTKLNIYFVSAGISHTAFQTALDECQRDSIKRRVIFESGGVDGDGQFDLPTAKIELSNHCDLIGDPADVRLDKLNREQRMSVIGILQAQCRPKPYILFGPPGTGKTHTLVEAVAQIYLRSPRARVLFCANSNTCVDQTYKKLEETKVFLESDLLCLKSGRFMSSSSDERIIVTTNIKSTNLASGPLFDYVFIDEAGHAHEVESLVPFRSLKSDGCLVLAGDPKQLRPVVQFEQAGKNGLESSMLERIIEWEIYQRKGEDNKYDSRYITKLLDCYRCDPRILATSNKLFYDNELRCLSKTPESLLKIMRLTSPVQVLFCNDGQELLPKQSTSYVNNVEIDKCVDLVIRLYKIGFSSDQIGIMTPYRRQVKEIRKKLKETLKTDTLLYRMLDDRFPVKVDKIRKIPKDEEARQAHARNVARQIQRLKLTAGIEQELEKDEEVSMIDQHYWERVETDWMCKIDTVDSFQGNERDVIIFSTVRTESNRNLGFLGDPRRFNVAMSRAKKLLFVIGKEQILQSNKYWAELLYKSKEDIKNWPRQSMFDDAHRLGRPLFRN